MALKRTSPTGRPILAVLIDSVKDDESPAFGTIHYFCEELEKELNERGWDFYIFTLQSFGSDPIAGFRNNGSTFLQGVFPPPSVVYNRIHSRRTEAGHLFTSFLEWAASNHIPVFNGRFLSKWQVHKMLTKRTHLTAYLPDTCLFSKRNLQEMSKSHNHIFAKPDQGSKGKGIYQVSRIPYGYEITPSIAEGHHPHIVPDSEHLIQFLEKAVSGKPYLLQQGIPLLKWQERNLDFRILCHIDQEQEWKITSSTCRLAQKGHFAANLAAGGEAIHPARILSFLFGREKYVSKLEELEELALAAAKAISQDTPWLVAELGMDIALDNLGKPWVIEANSKPSKEYRSGSRPVRPSAVSIADCAQFLLERYEKGELI